MDVLRHVLQALVPGGRVVDLASIPPEGVVLHGDAVVGSIDESAFFPRAAATAAALDRLAAEGMLELERVEQFPVLIHYPSGRDAVEDVAERTYGRMPDELAASVAAIADPVRIRETGRVRVFRKAG